MLCPESLIPYSTRAPWFLLLLLLHFQHLWLFLWVLYLRPEKPPSPSMCLWPKLWDQKCHQREQRVLNFPKSLDLPDEQHLRKLGLSSQPAGSKEKSKKPCPLWEWLKVLQFTWHLCLNIWLQKSWKLLETWPKTRKSWESLLPISKDLWREMMSCSNY